MKRHISELSLERAQNAIRVKLDVLEKWLMEEQVIPWLHDDEGVPIRDVNGELQLDFYPNNVTSFCKWNGKQNCNFVRDSLPNITSTNRGTLNGSEYEQLKISIKTTCEALKAKAETQILRANKTSQLKQLEANAKLWMELSQKQATDIAQFRDRQATTESSLRKKERALANAKEEHIRIVKDLEAKIAELTSTINKLLPMKSRGEK